MTDVRPMLDAIDRLYAAVLTPADWSAAVESVTDLLQAEHAIVCVPGGADGSGAFATVRMDAAHAALISSAEAVRLGSRMMSGMPIGLAFSWSSIISDRDWEKDPLYNEIIRPANGFYSVNALVDMPGGEMTGFNFCRPRKAGPFDLGEVDMLQSLLPHFTNVLELRRRLGAAFRENNDLLQVLERMDTGVILTDAASRPSFANGRALGIVAQADGLSLAAGRLSAAVSAATQRLRQAIAAASTHVPTAFPSGAGPGLKLRLKRPSGRPPLLLWLFPIQPLGQPLGASAAGVPAPRIAIFITEPDDGPPIDRDAIADAFELTPREAAIAALLAGGHDLAGAAQALAIGIGTARYHLKHVLDKTNTRSQATLVATLRGFLGPRSR
jgi:DNA-binding CsgD family transcriptional regulator/PAS domain-containing protein